MTGIARELLSLAQKAAYERDYARAAYLCEQALDRDESLSDARALLTDCKVWLEEDEHDKLHESIDGKEPEEALKLIDEYIERFPNSPRALISRAELRDDPEEAMKDIEMALRLNPADPIALYAYGRLLMDAGRLEEAEEAISRSIRSAPEVSDAYVNRAWIRGELGQISDALADVRAALKLEPDNGYAFAALSCLCLSMGHFDKVLTYEDKARSLLGSPVEATTASAEALIHLRRESEALPLLKECIERQPDDSNARILYAQSLAELDRAQEAMEQLEACEEEPREAPQWLALSAEVLLKLGKPGEVLPALDEAVRLYKLDCDENLAGASYNLAWCHAHRAYLAEKFSLPDLDVLAERKRAMELLKQAAEDPSSIRYALSERAFDVMRSEVEALLPVESDII